MSKLNLIIQDLEALNKKEDIETALEETEGEQIDLSDVPFQSVKGEIGYRRE